MRKYFKYFIKSALNKNYSELYGASHFMGVFERNEFLSPKNKWLVVWEGRLSLNNSFQNSCVVAPVWSGKSTKFVFKNLYNLGNWKTPASAVVTDPSGELFTKTSGFLSKTHHIKVLDYRNLEHSDRFNPLSFYTSSEEIDELASYIANHNANPNGSDRYWVSGATDILALAMTAIKNMKEPHLNTLFNLRLILEHLWSKKQDAPINSFMQKYLNKRQHLSYVSFITKEPKLVSWFLSTALAWLSLWKASDYDISILTSENTIDLESIRKKPTIIYLIVPEYQIQRTSLLQTLFYSALFKQLIKDGDKQNILPVFIYLDEFWNIWKLPNFSWYANTLRKRRVSLSIILQSLSQLSDVYGNNWKSIFEAMSNKIILPWVQDTNMLKEIEFLLGTWTDVDVSEKRWPIKISQPLLRWYTIRMMADNRAILISTNKPPVWVKMFPYYMQQKYVRLSEVPAYLSKKRELKKVEAIELTDYW